MKFVVFEVFEVRATAGSEVRFELSVDCPTEERAYRVHGRWCARDESFEEVRVISHWTDNLVEYVTPISIETQIAIQRALECDERLCAELYTAWGVYREDVAIYDRVAGEGRV